MKPSTLLLAICLTALALSSFAGAEICDDIGGCKPHRCDTPMRLVCQPTVTAEPREEECWEVECEYVCIPPVRFPWQPCGTPGGCGKIRRVRKLKKVKYECGTDYVWEWNVKALRGPGVCKPGYGPGCDVMPCAPCP
ncbi:MAG: hypothetical protein ACF8TS_15550 [Maioricimonas sp. JB049]